MSFQLRVKYLRDSRALYQTEGLSYASLYAAGLDLRADLETDTLTVEAGQRVKIPTGLAIQIPESNMAAFVYSRSGLGAKNGLTVAQGVGVIDSDYRGEILVFLLNTSDQAYTIQKGERIAQLVLKEIIRPEIIECDELSPSLRAEGGFGHTGK